MSDPEREKLPLEERWPATVEALAVLPAVKAPAAVCERTRSALELRLAAGAERAWTRSALAFLVAFAWTLFVLTGLLFELAAGSVAAWLLRPIGPSLAWYGAYLLSGWVAAAAAAVLLGRGTRQEGRIA